MSEPGSDLDLDRANRNAARRNFEAHVARLRGDVEAHGGVAGKVRNETERKLIAAGKQGLAIAAESKGIVAGTVAALGLWFFRKPLIAAVRSHFGNRAAPAAVQLDPAKSPDTAKETTD